MTNGTPHRIRKLEADDLEELFRLRSLLWDQVPAGDHQNEVLDILRHSDTEQIFVADGNNGHLAGFLEVSIRPFVEDCESDNVGYLEGWFVDEEHRRQGIGRELVRTAEVWARSKGCTEMASDVEFGNNISLSAHKELGYGETSRLVHLKKDL